MNFKVCCWVLLGSVVLFADAISFPAQPQPSFVAENDPAFDTSILPVPGPNIYTGDDDDEWNLSPVNHDDSLEDKESLEESGEEEGVRNKRFVHIGFGRPHGHHHHHHGYHHGHHHHHGHPHGHYHGHHRYHIHG